MADTVAQACQGEARGSLDKKKGLGQFAEVDLEQCRGCNLCQPVCPFEAISILPRGDGRPYETQVAISTERCESCGFCVSACPTSGIFIGEMTKDSMIREAESLALEERGEGEPVIIAFMCERSMNLANVLTADETRLAGAPEAAVMVVPCAGAVDSDLIQAAFRKGIKGAVIVGCRALDCHYREGDGRIEAAVNPRYFPGMSEEAARRVIKVFLVSRFEDEKVLSDIMEFLQSVKMESEQAQGKTGKGSVSK